MEKVIYLIGLFVFFSVTAAEKEKDADNRKRNAQQAELPDNGSSSKKLHHHETVSIPDQADAAEQHQTTFSLSLPAEQVAAILNIEDSDDLPPLPAANYQCPNCKGTFKQTQEEHEKNCYVLAATIQCPNRRCGRYFKEQGHLKQHLLRCSK
ncbi:MAG: hypothetical protein EBU90_09425 [Proteobacteria bacterium]|nr:hypothetical protein [Pseudomonadota bacterium]NBP14925.1 hypothetical protein [bacterium]